MITIYASPKSSSVRYFWCLEKIEETYNASSINLKGKQYKSTSYLRINP